MTLRQWVIGYDNPLTERHLPEERNPVLKFLLIYVRFIQTTIAQPIWPAVVMAESETSLPLVEQMKQRKPLENSRPGYSPSRGSDSAPAKYKLTLLPTSLYHAYMRQQNFNWDIPKNMNSVSKHIQPHINCILWGTHSGPLSSDTMNLIMPMQQNFILTPQCHPRCAGRSWMRLRTTQI